MFMLQRDHHPALEEESDTNEPDNSGPVKVYATEDYHPEVMSVKYYYEPTQTWDTVELRSDKTIGSLRAAIFR